MADSESVFHFEYGFHLAAIFGESIPTAEFLSMIRHPKIRSVAEAFAANVDRLILTVINPVSTIFWVRAQQAIIDEAHLATWGDLEPRQPDDPLKPKFDETVQILRDNYIDKLKSNANEHTQDLLQAAAWLESRQKNDKDFRAGLEASLGSMVTAAWTAFEILAGDLWEESLNAHPTGLATLTGKRPKNMPTPPRLFVGLASTEKGNNQPKSLRLDYLQEHGYDLSRLMGTVFRESKMVDFQRLENIRYAYIKSFDESHTKVRESILHPSLTALASVRNLLVHKGGIVDDRFMAEYRACQPLRTVFPVSEQDKPLSLSGIPVHNLIQPVIAEAVRLIAGVNDAVGAGE